VPFTVHQPGCPPRDVDAEEHRVEGGWHVFRGTTTVMGRPRTVVALRLAAADGVVVSPARGAVSAS
jgi:hypothetical protein